MLADPMSSRRERLSLAEYEILAITTEVLTRSCSNNCNCDSYRHAKEGRGCGCLIVPLLIMAVIILFYIAVSSGH